VTGSIAATAPLTATRIVQALEEARRRTFALVASVTDDDLERVHSELMSPLVWDLAHIAAYEDLWLVHRYGERPLLREDLAAMYDAFETPRAVRGDLPLLGPDQAREYLDEVRARTLDVIDEHGVGDGVLHEMVLRHEHQHDETMLQTLMLARLDGYELAGRRPIPKSVAGPAPTGLEMIEIPAGECTIGATADGFAYDNERPRHRTDVRAYLIGRTPITNASFLTFVEGDGYRRREWWTDEGWAWKKEYGITRPGAWTEDLTGEWRLGGLEPLHPDLPVVHVSWFEADAFARAHDARLPTEAEWERAATWTQQTTEGMAGIGRVWEWTASHFDGYPGFVAYPYREYSQVFFGDAYRVLRGSSWATHPRVASVRFRNWDLPQRRQIFAGVRLARQAR
jgi:gamma-glutamyl hercynylcysteine S-oxide synthase